MGTAATGSLAPATDAGLSYNASTNILTVAGSVAADVTGNLTGNASGTAATVTSATQAAITTVANGLKLWAVMYSADFTDLTSSTDMSVDPSTTTSGFPKQLHRVLAKRVIKFYKEKENMPLDRDEEQDVINNDITTQVILMKDRNMDRSILPTRPLDTGEQY